MRTTLSDDLIDGKLTIISTVNSVSMQYKQIDKFVSLSSQFVSLIFYLANTYIIMGTTRNIRIPVGWGVEYAFCISAEGYHPLNECPDYDIKLSDEDTHVPVFRGM